MTNKDEQRTTHTPTISPEALALLGGGKIAYVKAIRSEDVSSMFPQAPRSSPACNCSRCTQPTARR